MKPAPSFRISNAPRYQCRLTLAERLQLSGDRGWRPASADDLARLCSDDGDVSVIGLPQHLLKRWWRMAESDEIATGFPGYAREVVEYFRYKNWNLPPVPILEAVAADGKPDEALVPSHPTRFSNGVATLFAAINLADENSAIALGAEFARIRVVLEPGEGLMFPPRNIFWNHSALDDSNLAFTLLIGSLLPK